MPANAQFATSPGAFPRQSDFWQVQTNDMRNLGNVVGVDTEAAVFTVATDSKGRLPVLTQVTGPFTISTNVYVLRNVGGNNWRTFLRVPSMKAQVIESGNSGSTGTYYPGILLTPGLYAIATYDNGFAGTPQSYGQLVVACGYWARP